DIVNPFAAAFLSQLKEEETDEETGLQAPGETGPEEIQVEEQETTDADSSASTAESDETRKKGDVDLYELIWYSRVKEFNRLLKLSLEEFKKGQFKREIEAYQAKKKERRNNWYKKVVEKLEEKGKKTDPPLYWYVATQWRPKDWGATIINPWPPAHHTHKDIIPEETFDLIHDTPIAPDRAMRKTLDVKGERVSLKVDLRFIHYSSNCFFGTVREILDETKKTRPRNAKNKPPIAP
ncbi:MAG: hypothetical protein GY950_33655, partial [bacterium]|nr:hypothetical protein [bacterium]